MPGLHSTFAALAACILLTSLYQGAAAGSGGSGAGDPVVDALFAAWDAPDAPGCALAVARNGAILYSRGYGSANLDYDIPITPNTVFDVASITKQFVAANLNMLALEGKLSLDDNVRKWLPELPAYEQPITLRHMIYHTSGLRDYLNLFPLAGRGDYYPISHPMILAMMARQRAPISPPGEKFLYSNTAYMLLAQVIERAAGQTLGEIARTGNFEPLGMDGSLMYDDMGKIIPHRAIGYARTDDGELRIAHNYNFDVVGDGQLYSTAEDLLRWDHFLHGPIRPAMHNSMLVEGTLNDGNPIGYAQGLELDEYRGLRTVGHSGSSWGFRSQLLRFVGPGLGIAIACNSDDARPGELARRVADHFLADELGQGKVGEGLADDNADTDSPCAALTLTADELAALAGSYFSPELDATYRFSLVDGRLTVRIQQEPILVVTPVATDRFEIRFTEQGWPGPHDASLVFDADPSGAITGFLLSSGTERALVFEKQP